MNLGRTPLARWGPPVAAEALATLTGALSNPDPEEWACVGLPTVVSVRAGDKISQSWPSSDVVPPAQTPLLILVL